MEEEQTNKMETLVAVLIAVVVVVGAYISWRASVIDDSAGDADYGGLRAAIFAEKTRSLNYVNAYESFGNYVTYWRNRRTAELINEDMQKLPVEEQEVLSAEAKTYNDLADANSTMFEMRYLNRDGTYSVQRQMGEMWADAAKKREMDSTSQFSEADQLRQQTLKMLLALMILSVSPILFSLVESMPKQGLKNLMLGSGTLCALAGVAVAVLTALNRI
jgi:hypothetical protein